MRMYVSNHADEYEEFALFPLLQVFDLRTRSGAFDPWRMLGHGLWAELGRGRRNHDLYRKLKRVCALVFRNKQRF